MRKFGRNIVQFLPYFVIFYMLFIVSFLGSLGVKNQPGITALGLITIPAIICVIVAVIKTYRELPETGKLPGFVDREGTQTRQFNIAFGIIGYGLLILIILISTYFYYSNPIALEVPNNSDPSVWQNPSFENTILYEQMLPEERDKLLSEGVPNKDSLAVIIIADLMAIFIASLCFIHAYRNFGFWMASCFLLGSFLCTGMGESILILSGRFIFGGNTNNMLGDMFHGTFWYPKAWLWFIHCPIMICIGWYQVAYCCVWVATKIFPRINVFLRAVFGGLIAMNIDLWLDPVATSPEAMTWIWGKGDPFELFGIPVWNFWGWFLCITIFAVLWESLPVMKAKWGLKKGTINFFVICFFCVFIAMGLIYLYHIVLGGVFSLFGVQHAIQLPAGW